MKPTKKPKIPFGLRSERIRLRRPIEKVLKGYDPGLSAGERRVKARKMAAYTSNTELMDARRIRRSRKVGG